MSEVNTGSYQTAATNPGIPSVLATTRAVPQVTVSSNTGPAGPAGPVGPPGPPGDPTLLIDDTTAATTTTYSSAKTDVRYPQATLLPYHTAPLDYSGASDQTAQLQAALASGLALAPGVLSISGPVVIPQNVGAVGAGGGIHPGQMPTVIRCTTPGAGVQVIGCGGRIQGFAIDGNNVATQPLLVGQSTAQPGGERIFDDIHIVNSAGHGVVVQGRQNDTWINCQVSGCAGRGIVLDYGAGGILFLRQEVNSAAGSMLIQQSGASPSGAYPGQPQHVTFLHSIFERQTADVPAIEASAGTDIFFVGCASTGKDNGDTGPQVKLSGSAALTFTNQQLNSQAPAATFISLAGSSTIFLQGRTFLIGGATRPLYDLDVPTGTRAFIDGYVGPPGNSAYSIAWGPNTASNGDQTVLHRRHVGEFVNRNALTDVVLQTALASDVSGLRFRILANGALGWMDATSFVPDSVLSRISAATMQLTGHLRPAADATYDIGSANPSTAWRTISCRSVRNPQFPLTLSANGPVSIVPLNGDYVITLQANATSSSIPSAPGTTVTGHKLTVTWVQDATGGRTYVWPTNCKFAGTAPADTTASKRTTVTFRFDGTNWWEESRAVGVG